MSNSRGDGSDASDIEELVEIRKRCEELRKEKNLLRVSQSQSFELIKRLEAHVKTLSEARIDDKKHIEELERELKNCSQEIDFLQDQLSSRNTEIRLLNEHVWSLELKLAEMKNLQETVSQLQEELGKYDSEHLLLMQELDSEEVELQNSTSCIEKFEESNSSVALESQCEIESLKLDLVSLEQSYFEANKSKEDIAKDNVQMNGMIQLLEVQLQAAWREIQHLDKDNNLLREKLKASETDAREFCQKVNEYLEDWLKDIDGLQWNTEPVFSEPETKPTISEEMSTSVKVLESLLPKLATVAASCEKLKYHVQKMSSQIHEYEFVVQQLKDDLREEKLKAKDDTEDLAQEMAELRYQMTCLLEEECKRRVCIEQASLQRISELEARIRDEKGSFTAIVHLHE